MTRSIFPLDDDKHFVKAALLAEIQSVGQKLVQLEGQTIALFYSGTKVYAVDNRCPHMGFPLFGGPCKEGILTCPWHYARFDLASGGTFDSWADDVRSYPVEIREGVVWVDLSPHADPYTHHNQRLQDGLEQQILLVIAKSAIALTELGANSSEIFQTGIEFGSRYNKNGWGIGLSIHTCLMNLLTYLDEEDRTQALYQGLSAVARDSAGAPPRIAMHPLRNSTADWETLKSWFRQFIERRDGEAAERCIATAIDQGIGRDQIAELLFTAATDHRYLDGGHTVDFINKALEALDIMDWHESKLVLGSLIPGLSHASRMEETNSWRYPVDLVDILDQSFAKIPSALEIGKSLRETWSEPENFVQVLLGEDPQAIAEALIEALRAGCSEEQLARTVTYTAALRVARFHTNNEHSDWDSAHHPFTFANAVHQGMRRVQSVELLRGVFDAAMSVYLNRFLNVPPARILDSNGKIANAEQLLQELPQLLDRQQQVNEAGRLVTQYLYSGGDPKRLMALMGKLMLRENRDFHVVQELEAAFRQYSLVEGMPQGIDILVAAVRYLAAHSPTMRSQNQTYQMAFRLHKGDRLFEET
jgi:nitrite reductase/ring-hydroxylating ferredoxin subunit